MKLPSQEELDAVAHFREGVAEIRRSPLFIEEFRNLSLKWTDSGDPNSITAVLPEEMVVRDLLIPFRRLWQQGEPCHFRRVVNIIAKADPSHGTFIRSFAFTDDKATIRLFPWFKKFSISASDLVYMVINTRYMHVGIGQCGRFSRGDYENLKAAVDPVILEYAFLSTIHDVGLSFINIDSLGCKPFLAACEANELLPSFPLRHLEESVPGIERRTPGLSLPGVSLPQRMWRLRNRHRYDGINRFLAMINADDATFCHMVIEAPTFDGLLDLAGIALTQLSTFPSFDDISFRHWSGAMDEQHTALRNKKSRRGFVAMRKDGEIFWTEDYVPILRDQYIEFRDALLKEPFE